MVSTSPNGTPCKGATSASQQQQVPGGLAATATAAAAANGGQNLHGIPGSSDNSATSSAVTAEKLKDIELSK